MPRPLDFDTAACGSITIRLGGTGDYHWHAGRGHAGSHPPIGISLLSWLD